MSEVLFTIVILVVIMVPFGVHFSRLRREKNRRKTVKRLCELLFPGDKTGGMQNEVVETIMKITENRFTEDEVLDYYLKIKGLQLVDLNSHVESDIREFLMEPTQVRFHYGEVVLFYEKFLDQPQARGKDALESWGSGDGSEHAAPLFR